MFILNINFYIDMRFDEEPAKFVTSINGITYIRSNKIYAMFSTHLNKDSILSKKAISRMQHTASSAHSS